MNRTILTGILIFILVNSFAQHSLDTNSLKGKLIILSKAKGGNQYFVGTEKVKNLKPYLLSFPESALEYKKYKNNSTATLISMGIAIGGLTTILVSKYKETRKVVALYVNLPALAGMIYFGIKSKQHFKKSIDEYNKRVNF